MLLSLYDYWYTCNTVNWLDGSASCLTLFLSSIVINFTICLGTGHGRKSVFEDLPLENKDQSEDQLKI